MRHPTIVYALFAVLLSIAFAQQSGYTRCPYSSAAIADAQEEASLQAEWAETARKAKRSLAVTEHSLEALIKSLASQKYSISAGQSHQSRLHPSWLEMGRKQRNEPIVCGVPPLNCYKDKKNLYYRRIDGSCNNLVYPDFGMSINRYSRLLRPNFGDGIYSPAQSLSGPRLPSARRLSLECFGERTRMDKLRTMAAMQWGQMVAHDLTELTFKGAPADCCAQPEHKLCYPIELPSDCPIAQNTGKRCLPFSRAISDVDAICPKSGLPHSEKLTMATGHIDLSPIYGNTEAQSKKVRLFKGGQLRTSYINGQPWIPISNNVEGECGENSQCYSLPDRRNRFTPTIAVLHTLLLREHNRLAEQLILINPHYSDERLFEEARKINIAQFQKITYYEWVPLFLGRTYALLSGLMVSDYDGQGDFVNDYDETVNTSPYAEFSGAAFRYSHTQVPGWISLVAPNRYANQTLRLSDHFERMETIRLLSDGDNFAALLRGMATQLQKLSDGQIDPEIKHFFSRKESEEWGSDLKSLDIQRARDFGLASYNDLREMCGLRRAYDWGDFASEIPREKIELLRKFYATPNDVELSVAGSMEAHAPGALFGPTFLCIVGKQFLNARRGDRFFFEHGNHPGSLSHAQLAEIRKTSAASLFCQNAHYLESIQANVFIFPNIKNILLGCNEIPSLDINKWQDPNVRPVLLH